MKIFIKAALLLLLPLIFFKPFNAAAQYENAGEYMSHISNANSILTAKYLVYLSAVSHGKSARKVEKRRMEVLKAINDTRYDIMGMGSFKGDRTLKDTTVAYLKILNSVFNEDYGKIVNMEEIAEQSYDAMEAYLLAQEKANEKLNQAAKKQHDMQKQFADKHGVNLIEGESELEAKMELASKVMGHYNEVYLIFFKCHKQEAYLLEAVNKNNINAIEQNINSLQSCTEAGLDKLKELKGYNNDATVIVAARNMLYFFRDEVKKSPAMTDFYLKQENFLKLKKQFEAKSGSQRTQADIDKFNNAVNDINAAGKAFNDVNNELNKRRSKELEDWNKAVKRYMDTYMPVQQRQ